MDEEEALKQLQYYIEIGAIKLAGYDENGEAVFELKEDVTKQLAPELWQAHMEYIDNNLTELFEDGLMNVEYNENLEATMHFTEEGYEIALQKGIIPLEEI